MKKNLLRLTLVAGAVAGVVLLLSAWNSTEPVAPKKESMDCCKKKCNNAAEHNVWETSGQFFSSVGTF